MSKHSVLTMSMLLIVSAIASACSPPTQDNAACAHQIGYVTGGGKLNDRGLNQAGWEGVLAGAEAIGLDEACFSFVETADGADYTASIKSFVRAGFNIIVTSGAMLDMATREAGSLYPNVTFIGIDQRQPVQHDNVSGLVFREEEAGFLAGAVAGLTTESGVVGGVFGCEVLASSHRFAVGYRNGAQYVNPDVQVRYAYHPGAFNVCDFDAEFGMQAASKLVSVEQADVIFGAAGGQTGDGALLAACGSQVSAIGVNFDRYGSLPEAQPCLLASVVRDYVGGVRDLIVAAQQGPFPAGDTYGEVALAFHDSDDFITIADKRLLQEVARQLASGELDACAAPNAGTECSLSR